MNMILIGMPGAGKTSVGGAVARAADREFLDTDRLIEAHYGLIPDIFSRLGEEAFRTFETKTVRELANRNGIVVSTGGGIVLKAENIALLKACGRIVYLRAGKQTLLQRLSLGRIRPLLSGAESEAELSERIDALFAARGKLYEAAADYILDVDDLTVNEAAAQIMPLLEQEEI